LRLKTIKKINYTPITIFAYRLSGNNKWQVNFEKKSLTEVEFIYSRKFSNGFDFRLISDSGTQLKKDSELIELFEETIFESAWKFDPLSDSWRPPGEPIAEPKGNLIGVYDFKIQVNWSFKTNLPLEIIVNKKKIEMIFSSVFDPFPSLIKWLEKIIQGESSRILIDEEGEYHELTSYIKKEGMVRLIIEHGRKRDVLLDILIPIKLVVEQFYMVMHSVINSPRFMQTWFSIGERGPSDYKSDIIESFLKNFDA